MINSDIGRKVVYRGPGGWKVEEGVITSLNDTCVFVPYGADTGWKGTRREDLEWLSEKDRSRDARWHAQSLQAELGL
jgi:hypothetical protein